MNREVHVRFWERLGVKVPWATRHSLHDAGAWSGLPSTADILTQRREWPSSCQERTSAAHSITLSARRRKDSGSSIRAPLPF